MENLALRATLDWSSVSHGFDGMIAKAGEAQSRLAGGFSSLASTVGTAALAVGAAAGVAAVGAAAGGLAAFKSLEESASDAASKAVTIQGKSAEEIKAQYDSLKEHVMSVSRELGAATVFDPKQVSDAFGALAAAGKDVSAVGTEQLRPMLDLAASDMQYGLGPATQLVMSTMSQFGLSMQDTGKISDVLAKGAAGSAAGLGDYALAMQYVGPVAKATGVSLESTVAMISKVKDAGIDASTAGTSLRSSFLQLATPTKAINTALEGIGLTYADVDPRSKSFIDTLDLLKSKGADAFTLEALFGKESVSVVQTLMNATDEVRSFTGELENSQGVAKTMADLKMDSLSMDFEQAKGAAAELAIGLGEKLEPAARTVLQKFSEVAPQISELLSAAFDLDFGKIGSMLEGLGGAIVDYLESIDYKAIGESLHSMLKRAWGAAVGLFNAFLTSDTELTGAFTALADVLRPTFEDIFGTLQEAGLKALIAVGDAFYSVFNAAGKVVTDIMQIIIGEIADMAGALDEVTGGALSDLAQRLGILTPVSSTSTGTTQAEKIAISATDVVLSYNSEPVLFNKETGEKREFTGWSKQRAADFAAANPDLWSINKVTAQSATIDVQRGTLNLASAISDSKKDAVLSEMYGGTLHVQSVEANGANQFGGAPGSGWGLGSITFFSDKAADDMQKKNRDAWQEANSQTAEQSTETANKITESYTKDTYDQTESLLGGIAQASEDSSKMTGESIHDAILRDFNPDDWKDMTWQNRAVLQSQLDVLIDERETMKQQLEATIKADPTSEDIPKLENALKENAQDITQAVDSAAQTNGPGMFYGTTGGSTDWRSFVNRETGGYIGPTEFYDEFRKEKAMRELGVLESGLNVAAIESIMAAARSGEMSVPEAREALGLIGSTVDDLAEKSPTALDIDTTKAEKAAGTCVEIEHSMENIAKGADININTRSPNALKQGIFETSSESGISQTPRLTGSTAQAASGGISNAAMSSMNRYLAQIASNTNNTRAQVAAYGRSIYTTIQTTGTSTIAALNAQGSAINGSINTQGGAIVGAINTGVAAIIKALDKKSGGGGGGMPFSDGLDSIGSWAGGDLAGSGTRYSPGYIYGFSEGGFASKSMLAIVGDSPGGEFMVPRDRVDEFVSSYMGHQVKLYGMQNAYTQFDNTSLPPSEPQPNTHSVKLYGMSHIRDAIENTEIKPITVPVHVAVDSGAIIEAVEYAFKNISSDIRLRARI